ncbi:hypothetical protein M3S_J55 [Sorghum bicolor]|nr:hypothetical protein M3S_J55 [Sorghum bicolor]
MAEGNPAFIEHAKAQSALRRLGTPEDIANIVAFLASDEGGWITGQALELRCLVGGGDYIAFEEAMTLSVSAR